MGNDNLKKKILDHFGEDEVTIEDNCDLSTQSQDFGGLTQDQEQNVRFCKICNFKASTRVELKNLERYDHVKFDLCKKIFENNDVLEIHMRSEHTLINCVQCSQNVSKDLMAVHEESHQVRDGFAEVLEDVGKIKNKQKKPKGEVVDLRSAYTSYILENKAATRAVVDIENPD